MLPRMQRALSLGALRIYIVGLFHSALVVYGMWCLDNDEINFEQNEQQQEEEKIYALLLYSIHFLFIMSLFVSGYKKSQSLLLPWLLISAGLFSYLSLRVLDGIRHMKSYLYLELLMNLGCVGVCWYIWCLVYRTFENGYSVKMAQLHEVIDLWKY